MAVNDRETAAYRRYGYVVPAFRLGAAEVAEARSRVMALLEARVDVNNIIPITDAHMPHRHADGTDGSMMHLCEKAEILDLIENCDGRDLLLWTTSVFYRPAKSGLATPWHQDGIYWPIDPLVGTSAWIALSRCGIANGCLRVIPGSHKKMARHEWTNRLGKAFGRTLASDAFDEADAVDVALEAGQMMLFHPRLIHGSHPNVSEEERLGFTIRYIPSRCHFDHDGGVLKDGVPPYADRALFLMRGVNCCARNDLTRNHPARSI